MIVYDNSCQLEQEDCDTFLNGIGEIISRIKDDDPNDSRVAVIQFTDDIANVLIDFDSILQNNVRQLINEVKNNGDCTQGTGNTDVLDGVLYAAGQFQDDDRQRKIIIVSGCTDNENNINGFCSDPDGKKTILDNQGIDAYIVNLIKASEAINKIPDISTANDYLLCLADNDTNRVCIGDDDDGVTEQEFDFIIEQCLLPGICIPPTQSPTNNPTFEPTDEPSAFPTDLPSKSPSTEPTINPSGEPTNDPSPAPTDLPTKSPTTNPTDEPTQEPTPSPTALPSKSPSSDPTLSPTSEPTDQPTDEPSLAPTTMPSESPTLEPTLSPTKNPTPEPTPRPTESPIRENCPYEFQSGHKFDFQILYDNTCALTTNDCEQFLEGISEIASLLLDYPNSRIQTLEIQPNGSPNTLVGFTDIPLQQDIMSYVQYIRQFGSCTQDGVGNIDLNSALEDAKLYFDPNDDRIDKIIIVSACVDTNQDNELCDSTAPGLDGNGIDVYMINMIKASDAVNSIKDVDVGNDYLLCLTDNDPNRICLGNDQKGVTAQEFDAIVDDCLLPSGICVPPTPAPTTNPTDEPSVEPTPEPTANPTDSPTKTPTTDPTPLPTSYPTPEPTAMPTDEPSLAPTNLPTAPPTDEPTDEPTGQPSSDPTGLPTMNPTTEDPTSSPTMKPSYVISRNVVSDL